MPDEDDEEVTWPPKQPEEVRAAMDAARAFHSDVNADAARRIRELQERAIAEAKVVNHRMSIAANAARILAPHLTRADLERIAAPSARARDAAFRRTLKLVAGAVAVSIAISESLDGVAK